MQVEMPPRLSMQTSPVSDICASACQVGAGPSATSASANKGTAAMAKRNVVISAGENSSTAIRLATKASPQMTATRRAMQTSAGLMNVQRPDSNRTEPERYLYVLTRFLDANRHPLRSKTLYLFVLAFMFLAL